MSKNWMKAVELWHRILQNVEIHLFFFVPRPSSHGNFVIEIFQIILAIWKYSRISRYTKLKMVKSIIESERIIRQ